MTNRLAGETSPYLLQHKDNPVDWWPWCAEAVEAGLLPEDADDLLTPDYDPNVTSFQRAKGFIVPMEVVKMANQWRQESQRERKAS
jgi:hypothetical protein